MSISEQVKELRIAEETCRQMGKEGIAKFLSEAADTIEALSAKLSAVNIDKKNLRLRSCEIKIPKLKHYSVIIGGYKILDKISEARCFNGKFHKWFDVSSNENFPKTKVCGLIEYEDGTVHLIPIEYITFSDKNIESDSPANKCQ